MSENASKEQTETNRDKVLRGEPVAVTAERLKEMQKQAIAAEGIGFMGPLHWHWAAAINELVAARAERDRLRAALERYGHHTHPGCHDLTLNEDGSFGPRNGCLCGFDAALSAEPSSDETADDSDFCDCGDYPNGPLRRKADCPRHSAEKAPETTATHDCRAMDLANELARYFTSGNEIQVERATVSRTSDLFLMLQEVLPDWDYNPVCSAQKASVDSCEHVWTWADDPIDEFCKRCGIERSALNGSPGTQEAKP